MKFVNEKELWQDSEVRLNLSDPEIASGEKEISMFRVETSESREPGHLIATNLRLIFRTSRKSQSAAWTHVLNFHLTGDNLTVEIAESGDWKFRAKNFDIEKMNNIKKFHVNTKIFRDVIFRSPIIARHMELLASEKIVSEISGVWNVSGDAGNLGKLVVTNFRLVWVGTLAENSNVSVPHVAVRSAETRHSKFGKILVLEISRAKGGAVLGFRIDPESALEKISVEIARVVETALKLPWFGFDCLPSEEAPAPEVKQPAVDVKKAVGLVSRVVAAGNEEEEFCEELGLMINRLPYGVSYKTLWEIV